MRNHTLLDFLQVESQRGRIFKTVGLKWIPIGKMFTDSTTKVDSEPPNGSNEDITNPYKCNKLFILVQEFQEFKSDEHSFKRRTFETKRYFQNHRSLMSNAFAGISSSLFLKCKERCTPSEKRKCTVSVHFILDNEKEKSFQS
ncbi:hypothetical protein Tco_0472474 [Tanacetum coccineum]